MGQVVSDITASAGDKKKDVAQQMDELIKLCDGQCSVLEQQLSNELDAKFNIPTITELSFLNDVHVGTKNDQDKVNAIAHDVCQAVTRKGPEQTTAITDGVCKTIATILGGSGGSETKKVSYSVFFRNGGFYRLDTVYYYYHNEASSLFGGTKTDNALAYRARATLLDTQKANPQVIMAMLDVDSIKEMEKTLLEANRFYVMLNYTMAQNQSPELPQKDGMLDVDRLISEYQRLAMYINVKEGDKLIEFKDRRSNSNPPTMKRSTSQQKPPVQAAQDMDDEKQQLPHPSKAAAYAQQIASAMAANQGAQNTRA